MKLSKRLVDSFVFEGKENSSGTFSKDIRWDDSIPGFGIRIYPSQKKSFVLFYRNNGQQRFMTLGAYGSELTLDQARSRARIELGKINQGLDPLSDRKRAKQGETVKELCIHYMEEHAKPHKATWETDQGRIDRYIIPFLGNLQVKSISHSNLANLHRKIGDTFEVKTTKNGKETANILGGRYEANRVLQLLSKMLDLARQWGFVDKNNLNPTRDIQYFKESSRDRYVSHEELPKLTEQIEKIENIYIRNLLWMYLLSGARKSELLKVKWEDIDYDRNELRMPKTKNGKVHYLPLSKAALAVLENLPKLANNPYVFCGKNEGKPLVNIDKTWRRVRKDAGCADVRLHDLRRTLGSWMAQSGNSLHLIGKVLNHSRPSTTAIYSRFAQDHVREALEAHSKQIMGIAGKTPIAEIVEMPKKNRK
jgi:integrase